MNKFDKKIWEVLQRIRGISDYYEKESVSYFYGQIDKINRSEEEQIIEILASRRILHIVSHIHYAHFRMPKHLVGKMHQSRGENLFIEQDKFDDFYSIYAEAARLGEDPNIEKYNSIADKVKKTNIIIDELRGIIRYSGDEELIYPITKKRKTIVIHLATYGHVSKQELIDFGLIKSVKQAKKKIQNINGTFRDKLNLTINLIVPAGVDGYELNEKELDIEFNPLPNSGRP